MSQRTFFFRLEQLEYRYRKHSWYPWCCFAHCNYLFIRRARQKYPLLEEASISDFSTDNANQTKCSSKLETVEQRKGTDNEGKMVDNVRRTEAVRVIAMDDSKSSFAQQGVETVNENSLPTRIV